MHFGKRIAAEQDPEFAGKYINYALLKSAIKKEVQRRLRGAAEVPDDGRETSITVARLTNGGRDDFFDSFDKEMRRLGDHIQQEVGKLRVAIEKLQRDVDNCKPEDKQQRERLIAKATEVGDGFMRLEKFVNLNYLGLHKILKKHDKKLPELACRQFYIAQLHKQPWLAGHFSDVLVRLSNLFSQLRGDGAGVKNEDAAQGFVRSTQKYWVRERHVSDVKYAVLQHLPVFQFNPDPDDEYPADAQLINSVYLDNSLGELYHGRLDKRPDAIAVRLRWYGGGEPKTVFVERKTHRESWKGEVSVKERFALKERHVIPFLENRYKVDDAVAEMRAEGKVQEEIDAFARLFRECQAQVDAKQLRPVIRTQYMRTAFQIPFDATVRISLDTNLAMLKEGVDEGDGVPLQRWFRDPELELARTDITRFPHAVLEVKLSLAEGTEAPAWVRELTENPNRCTEVHKFSKFIHGTCTLFPALVQSVPYWVDDESVRSSMIASSPAPPPLLNRAEAATHKARVGLGELRPKTHPLLGAEPRLQLIQEGAPMPTQAQLAARNDPPVPNWFDAIIGADKPRMRAVPMKVEPKTFFANERTFLHWLHMAVTIGSISAALLGFAATSDRSDTGRVQAAPVELICMILLPLAVLLCAYALALFLWRGHMIAYSVNGAIHDKRGPLALATVVVLALVSILVLSIVDMARTMHDQGQGARELLASLAPAAPRGA